MRWLDSPPAAPMDVVVETPARLELKGPSTVARLGDGAGVAFGGLFAAMSLPFLRLPFPGPFRLVPLAFAAVGAGVAAVSASRALGSCALAASREEGLVLGWQLPGFTERVRRVPPAQLAALEVTAHHQTHEHEFGANLTTTTWRLVAVTTAGEALALETFATRAQAQLRRAAVEARVRGQAGAERERPPASTSAPVTARPSRSAATPAKAPDAKRRRTRKTSRSATRSSTKAASTDSEGTAEAAPTSGAAKSPTSGAPRRRRAKRPTPPKS